MLSRLRRTVGFDPYRSTQFIEALSECLRLIDSQAIYLTRNESNNLRPQELLNH